MHHIHSRERFGIVGVVKRWFKSYLDERQQRVKDLHWLPIKYRVMFKITLLVFKVLHCLTPSYLENLIRVKPEGRYLLRNKDQLLVPKTKRKTFGDRALFQII